MAARGVGVQVDTDVAVLLHALDQLRNAGLGVHAGRLGQHGSGNEVLREQLADAIAQLVADGCPGGRSFKVTNVVGHERSTGAENGQVRAAFLHQAQLVALDALTDLVVADLQFRHLGRHAGVLQTGNLAIAPGTQCCRRRGVVAVYVNNHGEFSL